MTTVQDILDFLQTVAPRELKMDWDNVGLLCGRKDKQVKTVFVALDPFEQVCKEAAKIGADLLLTHHPLIFEPLPTITDETTVGRAVLTLIRNDIAAVNAHTNLDCAEGGVNDVLAGKLGLTDIGKITGDRDGLLRQGMVSEQSLKAFMEQVKQILGCAGLRYADGGKPVCRVAVGGGSCGSAMYDVLAAGCDTFVTADVKYNQFCDASELGLNLIDAGHFPTENPVIPHVAAKLQAAFPEIRVIVSEKHTDSIKFF